MGLGLYVIVLGIRMKTKCYTLNLIKVRMNFHP